MNFFNYPTVLIDRELFNSRAHWSGASVGCVGAHSSVQAIPQALVPVVRLHLTGWSYPLRWTTATINTPLEFALMEKNAILIVKLGNFPTHFKLWKSLLTDLRQILRYSNTIQCSAAQLI